VYQEMFEERKTHRDDIYIYIEGGVVLLIMILLLSVFQLLQHRRVLIQSPLFIRHLGQLLFQSRASHITRGFSAVGNGWVQT